MTETVCVEREMRIDPAWDDLARQSSCGSIFMTSRWLTSWADTLGRDSQLLVVRIFAGGKLLAAAAFAEYNGLIEFAGRGPTDYSDILISSDLEDKDALRVLDLLLRSAAESADNFRAFDLNRIQAASRVLALLRKSSFYCDIKELVEAPRMDMSTAPEALRKKSLRRHERGLEKRGVVTCTTYTHATETLPRLAQFFDLHIARWANTDTASAFLNAADRNFYEVLVNNLDDTEWLRFTEVRLDDQLVAAHFGFMCDGCFTWYKPCYDPSLSKLSPGEVLIKKLIELGVTEDALVFDFTIGAEAFKLRFATEVPMVNNAFVTDSALRFYARTALRKLKRFTQSAG